MLSEPGLDRTADLDILIQRENTFAVLPFGFLVGFVFVLQMGARCDGVDFSQSPIFGGGDRAVDSF